MKINNRYLCIGENFVDGVPIGDCGETKTLIGWLEHLYPNTNRQILIDYFEGDPNNVVLAYIFNNKGKRLTKG